MVATAQRGTLRDVGAGLRRFGERHPWWVSLGAFAILAAAARPASFRTPLSRDTGQYLYVGETILHGGTPYTDAANNKGPLTFLLFAAIRLVDNQSVIVVRLTLLLFAVLAAGALAAYVTHVAGRAVGLLAGGILAVLGSATAMQGEDPNTEQYGIAPMTGAWWLATRGDLVSSAAAGGLVAAATLMNLGFVAVAPVVALELWRAEGHTSRVRRFGAALAGGCAVGALVAVWLGAAGALDDMSAQVLHQATTAIDGPAPGHEDQAIGRWGIRRLLELPAGALWFAGLLGCAIAFSNRALRGGAVAAALWIVVMWIRAKAPSYEHMHHFYPAMPGIAAGLALGIGAVWTGTLARRAAIAAMVLALPVWAYVVGPQWRALDVPAIDRWGPGSGFALAYPVADAIKAHTRPEDHVLVAGSQPTVYWLADRRAPTRFFDFYPVLWRASYVPEREAALRRRPPVAIATLPAEPIDAGLAETLRRHPYRTVYDSNGARVLLLVGRTGAREDPRHPYSAEAHGP